MKLKSIQVTNYRSVEDSGKFPINDITCLIGKNESGKTAILNAIEGIKPFNKEMKYNKTIDYPRRHLNDYKERHPDSKAQICVSEWELSEQDRAILVEEFGENCLKGNTVTVFSHYLKNNSWSISLDEKSIVKHLCDEHKLNAAEKAVVNNCDTVQMVYQKISESNSDSPKLAAMKKCIEEYRDQKAILKAIDLLSDRVPSFVYFSHYSRMSGEVSIEQYRRDENSGEISENDKVFMDFLNFAGTNIDEIKNSDNHEEFKSKLEAASNRITDQIFEYWTQNQNLEIEFDVGEGKQGDKPPFDSGTVMRARVKNTLHRVSVPFSERSAGFIWFFSFLVHFSQVKKHYSNQDTNVIVLLDEPGLTLHAKAQFDLLRYIQEKLAPKYQVIYSTHSPFMIIPDRLESIRVVEDVVEKSTTSGRDNILGTKVKSDFLETSRDTIFPLQSALGYEISQTLFVGKKVILVEGPSDILYLKTLSNVLKEKGRRHLGEWVLCPAGGIDKIAPFINLFLSHGEERKIVALTDYQTGHKNKVKQLQNSDLIISILLYSDFCNKEEADVEDLFEKSLYLKILKESCDIEINPESISDEKRIIREIDNHIDNKREFSHYDPSDWLTRNSNLLRENNDDVNKTLDRFENLFKKLGEIEKRLK